MALTDAQWAAVQVDVNVRLIAGTITEAQAVAELAAATEDWPTRSLSNADLALRVSKVLANLGGLIETEGPPSMDVGAPGATAFDSVNIAFYGPKTVESWGAPRSLLGNPGPAIELRVSAGFVQWRVVGAATWINLIALADLKGADGQQVELRTNATHIQWRLGAGTWTDLIALSALKGADGREIQLQKSATHIQWRYVGDAGWTDLVPLADITPTPVPGPAAWTPVLAGVVDGERRVQQIVDWVGGGGTKPATGKFIGPTGPVDTAAEATNWRGAGGSGSGDMIAANNLSDLTDDAAARSNLDVYSKGEVDDFLDDKQAALGFTPANAAETYTKAEVDAALDALPEPPALRAQATAAQVRAGKNTTTDVSPAAAAGAMALTALTDAATVAIDLDTGPNFTLLTTSGVGVGRTIGVPTNGNPGQFYTLQITADAIGRTVAWNTAFKWPKGAAKAIASAAANAVTLVSFRMISASVFQVVGFVEDIK